MNKIFYFTGTGNSLYIAKRIQEKIGGELISIPKALKENRFEFSGEKIGFVFPCYSFTAPDNIKEFISKANIKGDYFFSVMTYGNISAGGAEAFAEFCKTNDINLDYSNDILMVDNYLPIYDIDDQMKKLESKKIEENLEKILEDISSDNKKILKKGFIPKLASKNIYKISDKLHKNITSKFQIEESCTSCNICVKVCPNDNIKLVDGKPVFGDNCIVCLACTNNCPTNSIRMTNEKSRTRFRNENITVKEIIDSNN